MTLASHYSLSILIFSSIKCKMFIKMPTLFVHMHITETQYMLGPFPFFIALRIKWLFFSYSFVSLKLKLLSSRKVMTVYSPKLTPDHPVVRSREHRASWSVLVPEDQKTRTQTLTLPLSSWWLQPLQAFLYSLIKQIIMKEILLAMPIRVCGLNEIM